MKKKHIIITGASDGIGRALALECARRGARITASARSEDILEALVAEITSSGGKAISVPSDVTSFLECAALVNQACAVNGPVDVLVCNAGIGSAIQGDDLIPLDTIRRTMEVNFMGAVHATAAALSSLRQTRGLIVAISSLQGLIGFPKASAYSASKHAMQGFFDCLRIDLKEDVGVLVVSPGPVATGMHQRDRAPSKTVSNEKVVGHSMSAARCATLISRAIERRQRSLVMTWEGRLAAYLYPFFPGFVDKQVVKATERFYGG